MHSKLYTATLSKKNNLLFIIISFIFINKCIFSQSFKYISPKNNSILVSLSNNIILKSDEYIDETSLSPNEFIVNGRKSGNHSGIVKLSDDNKTILFLPDTKFLPGEIVNVTVKKGIKTVNGMEFSETTFHFKTTPLSEPLNTNASSLSKLGNNLNTSGVYNRIINRSSTIDTLPPDFPAINIDSSNNPSDGKIFIANKPAKFGATYGNYLIIADNKGDVIKYKKFSTAESNFRVLPSGDLMTSENGRHLILDTSLSVIDTFKCGNGYTADSHDFLLLPNGHALLFATDPQPMDMSKIVDGGRPDATVVGAVVQELDASKNVVFQWRTFDYIDVTATYYDLTQKNIPYGHANSLDVDKDGNILFSLRYLSAVVKINRKTGDIIWILGGKLNQFKFFGEHPENEPLYFSNQHNVNILPDGNILMFDNGDDHSPRYSRAVEYKLDEKNLTAAMVWEYDHGRTIYTSSGGSAQRLPNGNTVIGWSRPPGGIYHPTYTEVKDTSIVLEISFRDQDAQFSYRVFKFPWVSQTPEDSYVFIDPQNGNTYPNPLNTTSTIGVYTTLTELNADSYSEVHVNRYNYSPVNPKFASDAPTVSSHYFTITNYQGVNSYKGKVTIDLKYFPDITNPAETVVYVRAQPDEQFIPLSTSYDSSYKFNNKLLGRVLIADLDTTYFGDFLFGIPQNIDTVYSPVPFAPSDSEFVNGNQPVKFIWGTRGTVAAFHFQVATDSAFSNIITDELNLTSSVFTDSLINNNLFYWRVNNKNSAGTSKWSKTVKFFTVSPFIKIISPNGGEIIYADSTYIIRWQDNISDKVKIELLNNNSTYLIIGNSITTPTNAYLWNVPDSLLGSGFKIRITSIVDTSLSSLSDNSFTIDKMTGIDKVNAIIKDFKLYQNFPNPFNPSTIISYDIPKAGLVTLDVFNILGQKVMTLVDGFQDPGKYSVTFNAFNLSSGIYMYRLKEENFLAVKKFILIK